MEITQAYLKSILHYDPVTGIFTWKHRPASSFATPRACKIWNARFPGRRAGTTATEPDGYSRRKIGVNGKRHKEHRLAWVYMTGQQPPDEIDHINQDATDNSWKNLRDAKGDNNLNTSKNSRNTSGYNGVWWSSNSKKWIACIQLKHKDHYLGVFADKEDAAKAARDFCLSHGFSEQHGL